MPRRQALALVVLALVTVLPSAARADPATEAKAALSKMNDDVVAIMRQEKTDPIQKRALLEHFLTSNLDLAQMASEALGQHFAAMNKREFAEFSEEYSHYLTYLYLREISWTKEDGGGFEIVDVKADSESGEVTLQTRAAARSSIANVAPRRTQRRRVEFEGLYVLKKRHGKWRIIAIRFNGVDLNRVFGAQFASILESQSPEVLIEKLQQRNRDNQGKNPF
jgi:ABC-type transporter MlaC component